jgi:hypothetical protein
MSVWLLAFVPAALFFIVSGFCFVGCVLQTGGLGGPPEPTPFTKYSDQDVIANASCVAYWPLDEAAPADDTKKLTAHDAKGGNDGEYKHKGNAPDLFPCPALQIVPGLDSAPAIGFLSLGAVSLLPGDAVQPGNDPKVLTTGMEVDGAFVTVPANAAINPPVFTLEAWVQPEWKAGGAAATRAIVTSQSSDASGASGFILWVNEAGNWEGFVNDGTSSGTATATAGPAALGEPTYLAMTFDGTSTSLFVNGMLAGGPTALPAGPYSPNTTQPLIIGAGFGYLPPRTMGGPDATFPLLPFNGTIQDVAIYNKVLTDEDILQHFNDGSGKTTVPAG